MKSLGRTKFSIAAVVVASSAVLAACGGATVENSPTETSIAPLTRNVAPSSEESPASSAASESRASDASAEPDAVRPDAPLPQDQPAEEISEIPGNNLQLSGVDREYLDSLTADGVDVEGVEDQLIGTASIVCRGDGAPLGAATKEAVAGQLIEQGRSNMEFEALVELIDSSARKAYC